MLADRESPARTASPQEQPLWGHGAAFGALSADAYLSLGSMEGMDERPLVEVERAAPIAKPARAVCWPGYAAAAGMTAIAYAIHYLPFPPFALATEAGARRPISAAIIAIVLGVLARNLIAGFASAAAGCRVIVRKVLPGTIILTGAGLNLLTLTKIGGSALVVVIFCIALASASGLLFGHWCRLRRQTALLIGAGTAICGNSAIVAVAPLVEAKDEDLVLSIATVNLFGMVTMLLLPLIGGMLRLGDEAFGVLAGSTVHSVPQAVAAGFAYSPAAGALATLVKLVRVTLLAPLVFLLAVHYARTHGTAAGPSKRPAVHFARLVPWFVWGFIALALLNTLGLIPVLSFELPAGIWGVTRDINVSVTNRPRVGHASADRYRQPGDPDRPSRLHCAHRRQLVLDSGDDVTGETRKIVLGSLRAGSKQ
jgi:uncharacterized integral membrane protein (TIGR00698 family)